MLEKIEMHFNLKNYNKMEFVNLEKVLADIAKTLQNDYKKNLGESEIAGTITASVEVMGQEFEIVLDLSDY
jgi:hypothetical protein